MPNLPLIWLFIDQIYPKQKDFRPNIWVLFFVLENFRQNIWIVDHSLKGTHLSGTKMFQDRQHFIHFRFIVVT